MGRREKAIEHRCATCQRAKRKSEEKELATTGLLLQKTKLEEKYHVFKGNYHNIPDAEPYKFTVDVNMHIRLKMMPPPTGKTAVSFVALPGACMRWPSHSYISHTVLLDTGPL